MDSGNTGQTEKAKKDGSGSGEGAKRSVHLGTWKAGGSAAKTTYTEVKMGSEDGILQPGKYYKDPETAKEKEIKEPGA